MELNRLPEYPLSAANLSSAMVGSAPGDRMKINGAQQLESPNDLVRSNGGGSTKFLPSFSVTKFVTAGTTCTRQVNLSIYLLICLFLCLSQTTNVNIHRVKWRHSNIWSWYDLHVVRHDVVLCEVNWSRFVTIFK